jgi:hypothetical protein
MPPRCKDVLTNLTPARPRTGARFDCGTVRGFLRYDRCLIGIRPPWWPGSAWSSMRIGYVIECKPVIAMDTAERYAILADGSMRARDRVM